jgi:predicted phage baseplate assembly protein
MLNSDRGRILPPNLDDRTWQDLVDEALALIPTYAPQWTDYSPGDPGRTLIELFSWLVEGLIYRLNRVPEKNYIAFLNLLGITREPAVPAHVFLTFTAQPPAVGQPAQSVIVPQGTQAQTQGTETQAPIIFETDTDLSVLPTNLKAVLYIPSDPNDAAHPVGKYQNITTALAAPPANGYLLIAPGPSQAQPAQPVQLFLGFDSSITGQLPIGIRLFKSINPILGTSTPQAAITKFTYSTAATPDPVGWPQLPATNVVDNTKGLQQEGSIIVTPLENWAKQAPTSASPQTPPPPQWAARPATAADTVTDGFFWIGMTITNQIPAPATPPAATAPSVQVGLSSLLCNSVSAYNARTIHVSELLGQSDGTPFQVFTLQHFPLFKRSDTDSPYDHLHIQVGSDTTWRQADSLPVGAGNFYRLTPVTGTISFGNFDSKKNQPGTYGSIPPQGAAITALTYRYVAGGLSGNVGAGKVNQLVTHVDGIAGVLNVMSSFDAADEETIENTMRRAPDHLKSHDRAVTVEDYETLAYEATNEVVIARCLPPHLHGPSEGADSGLPWSYANINRAPGNINVIIVPNQGPDVLSPYPSTGLIRKVQSYLDTRRDLGVNLLVSGPYYLPIIVKGVVFVWSTAINQGLASTDSVKADIDKKLRTYLHPVLGGLDGRGWKVGQSVFMADLFKAIMPPENVGFISSLNLSPGTALYLPATRPIPPPSTLTGTWVSLADYELACYGLNQIDIQRQ